MKIAHFGKFPDVISLESLKKTLKIIGFRIDFPSIFKDFAKFELIIFSANWSWNLSFKIWGLKIKNIRYLFQIVLEITWATFAKWLARV